MNKSHIQILIEAKPREISKLYKENREAFIRFGKKYNLDYDDLIDIYQEAFIAIREQALNNKLFDVKSSFKTYLFGICKFKMFDLLKEQKKTTSIQDFLYVIKNDNEINEFSFMKSELSKEQQLLKHFFTKLGKKCQELLTLFYSRGLTIDEIVKTTNYKSNEVVRSQKSRCIKTLRELIKQKN
jgi:RNA polymerase sigma factor (sigma-70 family)